MREPTVCRFDKSILDKKAAGKIEALEDVFLTEHLKGCPECREYLKEKKQEKLQEKQKKLSIKNPFSSLKQPAPQGEPSQETQISAKVKDESVRIEGKPVSEEGNGEKNKTMKLAEVVLRGSTAGVRAIPFREILTNIKKNMKNKQKGGSGSWES